ncbi:MAG: shikimate kinase [Ruminococcaceae bacterium]|nr:shikimate kinase [Oscillospiraceae bacterium]
MKNIVLIGFTGTGKTTIGRRVAAKLNIEFYDTDEAIRRCEKMPVHELLQKKGAKYFEGAQRFAVSTLAQNNGVLISTGGETVLDAFNVEALRKNGILFWLKTDNLSVYQNTRGSLSRRPVLAGASLSDIEAMMKQYEPFYEKADVTILVNHDDMDATTNEIIQQYKKLTQGE